MIYCKVFSTRTPVGLEDEIDSWLASVDNIEVLSTNFTVDDGRYSVLFMYEDLGEQ